MLKSNVMVIAWNKTVVGREQQAVAFFSQTLELYAKWPDPELRGGHSLPAPW
jgi:hypothetical protein